MVFAVIGTGNIGQALVRSFTAHQMITPDHLRLFDVDQEKAKALAAEVGGQACASPAEAVQKADAILLAVKPQVVPDVLPDLALSFRQDALLISIAAGITLSQLRSMSGARTAIARVMPNTPALVGAGVSAVCFDRTDPERQQFVLDLLASCGMVKQVPESLMDAVTALSGSGPAYVMLMIEAMADGGVRQGLSRDAALEMAAMTVYGSAKLVLETRTHPAILKDQVCSPAGTTIEAIAVLEQDGLRASLIRAIAAAADRSRHLRERDDPSR